MSWQRVSLIRSGGELRAPGHVVAEIRLAAGAGIVLLTGHELGTIPTYARLLCRTMAGLGRPWCAEADAARIDGDVLRLARRSGCRALVIGPDPDPLRREADGNAFVDAARDLRRIRRAGLLSVVHLRLGLAGDDAGVFERAVRLLVTGHVAFPRLAIAGGDDTPVAAGLAPEDVTNGVEWARRALYTHRALWRRVGASGRLTRAALVANYRARRAIVAGPPLVVTPVMRLARALARPIRVRERVAFVSTLVGAVPAQMRNAWLRMRTTHDRTLAALVIRLEGAIDARAARTLVARVTRAVGRTPERIIIDLGGLELVSSTIFTRFVAEHAAQLEALRGRLAFRNLQPALEAVRRNLNGLLPNAPLLEHALDEG